MNVARMYTIALGSFGYTVDEARFVYLVAGHGCSIVYKCRRSTDLGVC